MASDKNSVPMWVLRFVSANRESTHLRRIIRDGLVEITGVSDGAGNLGNVLGLGVEADAMPAREI